MTLPEPVVPMLATAGPIPIGAGWAFEWKWDGVRAIVAAGPDAVRAYSRNGRDITGTYPELAGLSRFVRHPVLLDGEVVTLDSSGRPDFGRLQSRMNVLRPTTDLMRRVPVGFYAFDLLSTDGDDLCRRTYVQRRAALAGLALESPPLVRTPANHVDADGVALQEIAREHGLEGVIAKRLGSHYHPGARSRDWIKTPLRLTQEVIICGWTPGEGRRAGSIGALMLGVYDEGRLRYAGQVGTGFSEQALRDLNRRLAPLVRADSPFDIPVPRDEARGAIWTDPVLVGEVEHRQWTTNRTTGERRLRHPSWRGLRSDKRPTEITAP